MLKKYRIRLCLAAVGFAAFVAVFLFRRSLGGIRSAVVPAVSRFFESFTAGEFILVFAPFIVVLTFIWMALKDGKDGIKSWLVTMLAIIMLLAPFLGITLMSNYTSPTLSERLGILKKPVSAAELESLCEFLAGEMNELAPSLPRDANGSLTEQAEVDARVSVRDAYIVLGWEYPFFSQKVGIPKTTVIIGKAMSWCDVSGFYFPLTCEGIVSSDTLPSHLGFTLAHEAAHVFGVGLEDEANFAAFLCTRASQDQRLRYSGVINAYVFAFNALYGEDPKAAARISDGLCREAVKDLYDLDEHVKKYMGSVTQKAGDAVNDAYITFTGQPAGIESYGMVVDLLLWWYSNQ